MEKKTKDKNFYNEILDTQLFQQFTQNVVNEDVGYFNYKITLKEEKKKGNNDFKNKEIKRTYYINPDFLNIPNNNDNMKELIEMSNKKYPENKNKERVKVLENSIVIEDSDYNDNDCKIYMTQEEKELRKEQKPVEAKTQKKVIVANNNSAILQRLK